MIRAIVTCLYVGLLPKAPGTWGSLAALPCAALLHVWAGFTGLAFATLVVAGLGWWATDKYIAGLTDHDPSEVVIDEVVGQWITLLPLSAILWTKDIGFLPWPGLVFGFAFFRLFDIWKPWPISWADKRGGATGVMLDDILAGIAAALAVTVLGGLYHGLVL